MQQTKPRIVEKMLLRTALLLFAAAAVIYGIMFLMSNRTDLDAGDWNTQGMVAAVKYLEDGSQAIVFGADGKELASPGYKQGATDRELAWQPDGQRLYFVSDREEENFHLYRWNGSRNLVERRSFGSSSRGAPSFASGGSGVAGKGVLLTSRGTVLELDPRDGSTVQMLPPALGKGGKEDEGATGQFEQAYSQLGTSFRTARWVMGRDWIVAVMRREQGGEILLLQNMDPKEEADLVPKPLMAAERIDFDVDPTSGKIIFAVLGFEFIDPAAPPPGTIIKDNVPQKPYRHALGVLDVLADPEDTAKNGIIASSQDDSAAFMTPSVSPDGKFVAAVMGTYDGAGAVKPKGILRFDAFPNAGPTAVGLGKGEVYEPDWAPDGSKLVFSRRLGQNRSIFVVNADGTGEQRVSPEQGRYGTPRFSPQIR